MKKKWLYSIAIMLYAVVWFWIFLASARAGCSENDPMAGLSGLCLARRIAGLSCFAIYLGAWTFLGAHVAMAKGRNPIMGAILGFTLQFGGCLGLLMLEPRRDLSGRMIHWDEYKHYSKEEREAIRPLKIPDTPEVKLRKKVVTVFAICTLILVAIHACRNQTLF